MASRGTLKTMLLQLLGTSADDPAYPAPVLENALQMGDDSLITEIVERSPQYFEDTVTLTAVSATSHEYALAAQAPMFSKWLEVRMTNEDGGVLEECRSDQLRNAGPGFFAVTGPDQAAKFRTSHDTTEGSDLWLRFGYWPALFADDNSVSSLPARFHDVIALEALPFVYGVGAEQRMSPELIDLRQNRKALLFAHCTRRGSLSPRVRLDVDGD